jgi:hypothetical protein
MTLLTDCIPESGLQGCRVDDAEVAATHRFGTPDVQLARPMASLAAYGIAPEDRRLVPIDGPSYVLNSIRVTKETTGDNRPSEVKVLLLVARGKIPPSGSYIACDWRQEQEAVALGQVRQGLSPGSEGKVNLCRSLNDEVARGRPSRLAVEDVPIAILDEILEPSGFKQHGGRRLVSLRG